jgi:hypothetical protein
MAAVRRAKDEPIYQLKVTLLESKPPIWRVVQVPGGISLARLHQILQVVMGWEESHLHQFKFGRVHYGEPDPAFGGDMKDERRAKLMEMAPHEKDRFIYEYDFGDSWEHEIRVEKILPAEPGITHPICLAGERAGPPEDCGGVWGYESLLEAIADPSHPEHEEMLEWVGDDFDPEALDLDETNKTLRRLR